MPRRLIAVLFLFLPLSLPAAEAPGRELGAELLVRTGTLAVLANPRVQAALADPRPFMGEAGAPRRLRLLDEAGFREWQGLRLWVLEWRKEGETEAWRPVSATWAPRMAARGCALVSAVPLPAAVQAMGFLVPGQPAPSLAAVLAAYGADVLVLVKGGDWSLWSAAQAQKGSLPPGSDALPEVLAETLAAAWQWPEAAGRTVLQVEGVTDSAGLAGVLAAVQALPGARQPQLVRATRERAWIALAAPAPEALATALEVEPRLPAAAARVPGQSAAAQAALRQASPLLLRQWRPDLAPPPPAPEASTLQSPPY